MTFKQITRICIVTIILTILFVTILCIIAPPKVKYGESYINKTVESKSDSIYNIEQTYSYQPGDVRTLPNISVKEN